MIPGFTKDTWNGFNYDDSSWETACEEEQPPKGVFRECLCEPIRICEEYEPKEITKIGEQKYLFDFGQNMSGFARLNVNQPSGDKIVLEYAESMNADHTIQYHGMNEERLYADRVFQTDDFICCGKPFSWTPLFTYHGFRYVVVSGLKDADQATLTALFVHQDVKRRTEFECSEQSLNKLFEMGIYATYSNLFYMPTDCPTREKQGFHTLKNTIAICRGERTKTVKSVTVWTIGRHRILTIGWELRLSIKYSQ